ncbi:MAG: serine O-acetyltransferase [Saprospiraceae bacterium]|nr:serine O-acetyltransferase [Saprospiraceae bacterium]
MEKQFIEKLYQAHKEALKIPAPKLVCHWLDGLLNLLFPELSNQRYENKRSLEQEFHHSKLELYNILNAFDVAFNVSVEEIEQAFMQQLPQIHSTLLIDASAILKGDPAATNLTEVIRTYPGFYALAVYRIAHIFYDLEVPLIPRILTESAHNKTGIDIHPGAVIGEGFCIDHGTGVVIGETVIIGKDVKIYQGVTLGALSVRKEMAQTKRHPTIEDRVVIYAGATILGGNTIIGHDSMIGGSVWITKSIPPFARVYYNPVFEEKAEVNN